MYEVIFSTSSFIDETAWREREGERERERERQKDRERERERERKYSKYPSNQDP